MPINGWRGGLMAELDRGQSGRDSVAEAVEGWITANGGGRDDRDAINEP